MTTLNPKRKAAKKPEDPIWSFDFRTPLFYGDSDSEGSDSGGQTKQPPVSAEVKLLRELDLSTREENVKYKPNPFSIAKMNAAYRSNNAQADAKKTAQAQPLNNPRRQQEALRAKTGQTTLFESFETQKRKAMLSLPQRVSPQSFSCKTTSDALKASNSSDLQRSAQRINHPVQNIVSGSTSLSNIGLYSSINAQKQDSSTSSLNEATNSPRNLLEVHIATGTYFMHDNPGVCELDSVPESVADSPRRKPVISFSSPAASSPSHRSAVDIEKIISHTPASYFSSPIRPHASFNIPFAPKRANHPKRPSKMNFSQHIKPRTLTRPHPCTPLINSSIADSLPNSTAESLLKYEDTCDDWFAVSCRADAEPINKIDLPDSVGSPTTAESNVAVRYREATPLKETRPALRPISSFARHAAPFSGLDPQKKRSAPRDAYTFSLNDADEDWNTLPPSKRKKIEVPLAAPKFTNSFTVRGTVSSGSVIRSAAKETNITNGRRVHTYLPPPPAPLAPTRQPANLDTVEGGIKPAHHVVGNSILLRDVDNDENEKPHVGTLTYPSPMSNDRMRGISSDPSLDYKHVVNMPPKVEDIKAIVHRLPSPSTSDLAPSTTLQESDVHVAIDVKTLRNAYPFIRATKRKRKHIRSEMWDILGLESCGVVFRDDDRMPSLEQEIRIVVWGAVVDQDV